MNRADIYKVIAATATELNGVQPQDAPLHPVDSTPLTADGAGLSSLAVVMFVLAVEERLSEVLQRPIVLFNEQLIADGDGPFRTIGSFVDYIETAVQPAAR